MELAAGFAVASLAKKGVKILTGKFIAQNCVGLAYSVRSFSGVFFDKRAAALRCHVAW